MADKPPFSIKLGTPRALGVREVALLDSAKKMFADSVLEGRTFCKEMIGISTGAIAVYYALFAYLVPEDYQAPFWEGVLIVVPPILFFVAAAAFAVGYSPRVRDMTIQRLTKHETNPDGTSVEEVRTAKVKWTNGWAVTGMAGFFIAIVLSAFSVLNVATAEDESSAESESQSAIVVTKGGLVVCGELAAGTPPAVVLNTGGATQESYSDVSALHLVERCPD